MDASRRLAELAARHDQLPCPWCIPGFTWCPFCNGNGTVTARFIIDQIRRYQRTHQPPTNAPRPKPSKPAIPVPPPPPRVRRPIRWTANTIIPYLVAARADIGEPFTRNRYHQWSRSHPGTPSIETITRHHRTWAEALQRAGIPAPLRPNETGRRNTARSALTTFLNTGQTRRVDYDAWRLTQTPRPPTSQRILRWTSTDTWVAAVASLNYPKKRTRR